MAYENISVFKLESALNKIDNINYESINNLNSRLTADQWSSPIRSRIRTALKEIVSEYKIIQNEIKKYKQAADFIKEYKESDDDYERYQEKARSAKQNYDRYKYKTSTDPSDAYWKQYYKNKYDEYISKQSSAQGSKNQIKNKINNLIN